MRNLKNIAALIACTVILLSSCNKAEPNPQTDSELQEMANLLNTDWQISSENAVTLDDNTHDANWANFGLSIRDASEEGGTYAVSGVPLGYSKVWSNTGNWTFENSTDPNFILRSDGVSIRILKINDAELSLEFEIQNGENSSLRGLGGNWQFTLVTSES